MVFSPRVFKPTLQEMLPSYSFIFALDYFCIVFLEVTGTKFGGHSTSQNHSGYPEEIYSLVLGINVKQTSITTNLVSPPTGSK